MRNTIKTSAFNKANFQEKFENPDGDHWLLAAGFMLGAYICAMLVWLIDVLVEAYAKGLL